MSGKGHRYYNCRTFTRTGKEAWAGYRIPQSKLDDAVLSHLADKLFTLERCREILRDRSSETFAASGTSWPRRSPSFLVRDITVRGAEVTIRGRTDAVALLAGSAEPGTSPLNHSSAVLTSVVG
jgi:hypothetical protein